MAKNDGGAARAGLAVATAAAAVLAVFYFGYNVASSSPWFEIKPEANFAFTLLSIFLERLFYLAVAAVVCAAALAAGLYFLRKVGLGGAGLLLEAVFALAIGLGALSLATLVLGVAGLANRACAIIILAVFAVLGARPMCDFVARLRAHAGKPWTPLEKFFGAAAGVAGLLTLLYAFNPPMNFDALEYHLGAPAWYFNHGAIRYIKYNVYSNFPANSEMLYLFSMALLGSKMAGAILGKIISAYAALAAAGAAYCTGRWLFSRGAGLFAAAVLLASGGFFQVATGVYVEGLQTLYTLAALLAVGRYVSGGRRGWLVAGGVAAGLAFGVKYTAAPFVALPLCLSVALRGGMAKARIRASIIFAVAALAAAAPWLVKNIVFTGNPFYPLAWSIFGGRDWSAMQEARWAFAHTPKGGLAWEQWARHVFGMLFAEAHGRISLMTFVFVPLAFLKSARSKRMLFVLGYGLLTYFLWFAFTHRIERFLVPTFAVLATVSGAGLFAAALRRAGRALVAAAVFLTGFSLFYTAGFYGSKPDPSVPLFGGYEDFLSANLSDYPAWLEVNRLVGRGEKVLLFGASQTFYLDVDYEGTTVFDRKPLEEIAAASPAPAAAAALKERGFKWIFVDWATLRRQQESYTFDFEGESHAGYSSLTTPTFFDEMERAGIIRKVYSAGPTVYPSTPAYVLYILR